MPVSITPLYAVPVAVLFMYLAIRVIRYRRAALIAFGDNNDRELLKRMRAHGNCAEYAPLGLLLLLIAELAGAAPHWLHLTGLFLVIGRVIHGIGLTHFPRIILCRVVGITATFAAYLTALILALV